MVDEMDWVHRINLYNSSVHFQLCSSYSSSDEEMSSKIALPTRDLSHTLNSQGKHRCFHEVEIFEGIQMDSNANYCAF